MTQPLDVKRPSNPAGIIEGRTGLWETIVGLEIHAQVISESKLFSGAATAFGAEPNSQVSFVDAAMPGMLPVVNTECIRQAIRVGLAIEGEISRRTVFDRKNYFYADLPQGYQISQYSDPIVENGAVRIDLNEGGAQTIRIERIQLEQDAGKSLHDQSPTKTYVDLNRSGVALMEIVSRPDMRAPEEADAYIRKIRTILRTLGACDGNMEQGSLRCDVNVSVRRVTSSGDAEPFGTRTEVKNVNSIRAAMQAITYEAARQVEVLEGGGEVDQETRLWDANLLETRPMRSKENAHDYRYFPDPDLPPLYISEDEIAEISASMPELPDARRHRFMSDYGLSLYDATVLVAERERADFYERAATGQDARMVANWLITDLLGSLNKADLDITASPISPEHLGALVGLISNGDISGRIAKDVFTEMVKTRADPVTIVEAKGLCQISDSGAIENVVHQVLAEHVDKVEQYRGGKSKLFGFFVGQVMKATGGQANPSLVNNTLKALLDG